MPGDLQLAPNQQPSPFIGKDRMKTPRGGRNIPPTLSGDDPEPTEQFRSRLDMMPTGDEPWLRYPAAAAVLGISRGTLEVWLSVKRYAVPHYKVGRNVLFKRSELVAWLESRRRGGDAV
jgi:excisionase family DNA binding protein